MDSIVYYWHKLQLIWRNDMPKFLRGTYRIGAGYENILCTWLWKITKAPMPERPDYKCCKRVKFIQWVCKHTKNFV